MATAPARSIITCTAIPSDEIPALGSPRVVATELVLIEYLTGVLTNDRNFNIANARGKSALPRGANI